MKYKKDFVKGKNALAKSKCDVCKRYVRIRHLIYFKGKYRCNNCLQKTKSYREMQKIGLIGKPLISLKEALKKTYTIIGYFTKKRSQHYYSPNCVIAVPSVLYNKKVKLKLIK